MRRLAVVLLFAFVSAGVSRADVSDRFLWLENVHGARATQWVAAENAKTLGVLEKDPHYAGLYANELAIAQAKDRIPYPEFLRNDLFNFWQDDHHVRGVWRSTSPTGYASAEPAWSTVLDVDALAKSEHANWVWEGANCHWPSETRCLVRLSDGGEDAATVREFDLAQRRFVADGFTLPRSKQTIAWEDDNSLLVAREWNPGELTTSGYPFIIKRVKRGEPLSQAVEVFRGMRSDVSASPAEYVDGTGHHAIILQRGVSFFSNETYVMTPGGPKRLNMPMKANVVDLLGGRLLIRLDENWNDEGTVFDQGSLVSVDLAAATADPQHLHATLVYKQGDRETLDGVTATRSHLIVTVYHDVKGRMYVYTPQGDGQWSKRQLDLPDNASVSVAAASPRTDKAFINVTSYLTPPTLWLVDTNTGVLKQAKSTSAKFDASSDVVEQHEATSTDGTQIPYFIVHPKKMTLNGNNPTILYAYGGFSVSLTPSYNASIGKLWLERGGVYVVANIRGGGEFGPAWHDAGLKTHRQRIYDDFAAVAKDLIARKITSSRRLGIQGGSNGGLLMGVEFTEHPELWHAVDIQVPLLDMLRFEKIEAGASWVGEYGSVSIPSERAFLAKISPYNNLRAGVKYPEPLIWTTTKDDRVGPEHARKFAAKLASLHVPYLYYEVTEGGHGSGANIKERSRTTALEMAYFIRQLMN